MEQDNTNLNIAPDAGESGTVRRRRSDKYKNPPAPVQTEADVSEGTAVFTRQAPAQNVPEGSTAAWQRPQVRPQQQTTPPAQARPKVLERVTTTGGDARYDGYARRAAFGSTNRPAGNTQRPVQNRPSGTYQQGMRPPVTTPETRPVQDEEPTKRGPGRTILTVLVVILVVIGIFAAALMMTPSDSDTALGKIRKSVESMLQSVMGAQVDTTAEPENYPLSASPTSDYVPAEVVFSAVTPRDISEIRLVDAMGSVLDAVIDRTDTEDGQIQWTGYVVFESSFYGAVTMEVPDGEGWKSVGVSPVVSIAEEQTVREESTPSPVPTEVSEVLDFSASPSSGTAPVNIAFSMTTSISTDGVRLVDKNGNPLDAEPTLLVTNQNNRIWALNMTFEEAYSGVVRPQVLTGDTWMDATRTVTLQISAAPSVQAAQETPVVTPVPETEAPVVATETPAPVVTQIPLDSVDPDEDADDEGFDADDLAAMDALADEWVDDWADDADEDADAFEDVAVIDEDDPYRLSDSEKTITVGDEALQAAPLQAAQVDTSEPVQAADAGEEVIEAEATPQPKLTAEAAESADPSLIKNSVIYSGTKTVKTYDRPMADAVNMPDADNYNHQPFGVMTFRGSSFRQNAAEGTVQDLSKMEILWTADAGSVKAASSTYYGIGWTGQPLIIKWAKIIRENSNIYENKINTTALREVIIAGEDGKIYFLDLTDGQPTRDPIDVGYPMRGTPSVHTKGYPVLAVGQYARKMAKKTGDIGLRIYNLFSSKQALLIDGLDGKAKRPYNTVGSFETSSLFDYNSDTMISIGTNGMLYLTKMNAAVDKNDVKLTMDPTHVSLKTKASGESDKYTAVESSIAAYQNYVFYADMGGILRCVDVNTLTTVWAVDTGDSVEAAVALELDGEGLLLYTANTLATRSKGDCQIRCYNALTGEEIWEHDVAVKKASKKDTVTPGAKASPVVGRNDLEDFVYFTLSSATIGSSSAPSVLLALNKVTGEVEWTHLFEAYTYSSPVAVYAEDGRGWIIQATSDGNMYLLDGLSGTVIDQLKLEGTINASPAVYKNILVIGTQGKNTSHIYGIALR